MTRNSEAIARGAAAQERRRGRNRTEAGKENLATNAQFGSTRKLPEGSNASGRDAYALRHPQKEKTDQ